MVRYEKFKKLKVRVHRPKTLQSLFNAGPFSRKERLRHFGGLYATTINEVQTLSPADEGGYSRRYRCVTKKPQRTRSPLCSFLASSSREYRATKRTIHASRAPRLRHRTRCAS